MPPKANDRLDSDEIKALEEWIRDGAVWPEKEVINEIREARWSDSTNHFGEVVKSSGGQTKEWTYRRYEKDDIWAIQPIVNPKQNEVWLECRRVYSVET